MTGIRANISLAFDLLATNILFDCPDPKGLGDNLNHSASWEERTKVSNVAKTMAAYARIAMQHEKDKNEKLAIETWQKVFPNFPAYG